MARLTCLCVDEMLGLLAELGLYNKAYTMKQLKAFKTQRETAAAEAAAKRPRKRRSLDEQRAADIRRQKVSPQCTEIPHPFGVIESVVCMCVCVCVW